MITGGLDLQAAHLGEVAKRPILRFAQTRVSDPVTAGMDTDSNGTPYGESRILHFTDPVVVVRLYHHLLSLNQEEVFKSLMSRFLLSTNRLGAKAPSLYLKIILPLAKLLLQSPLESIGENGATSKGNTHVHFNTLWRHVLLYFVGPAHPSRSFATTPVDCRCRDCAHINRFLVSADQTQIKVLADKDTRQHLHQELDYSHYGEVTHETQRTGNPEPLIITKVSGEKSKKRRAAWNKRAAQARDSLLSIPEELLKKAFHVEFFYILPQPTMQLMLGPSWERIWRMCPPDPPPEFILDRLGQCVAPAENITRFAPYRQSEPTAEPQQGGSNITQQGTSSEVQVGSGTQSLVPAKRKAEVVDLTED